MNQELRVVVLAVGSILGSVACFPEESAPPLSAEDYLAADLLFEPNLLGFVKNETVQPTWLRTARTSCSIESTMSP